MRISELAHSTGVSLPTVKYYLREGLLPAGRPTAATQAEYDQSHVDRLRTIRALVEVGGLSLAAVRSVLSAIDAGPDRTTLAVGTAHATLGAGAGTDPAGGPPPERALAVLRELGWCTDPGSPAVRRLDTALAAVEQVGIPLTPDRLRAYADAAMAVARVDVASVPRGSAADAVTHVVLGTVLYEPVLLALRRLAQQEAYLNGAAVPAAAGPPPPAPPAA